MKQKDKWQQLKEFIEISSNQVDLFENDKIKNSFNLGMAHAYATVESFIENIEKDLKEDNK